jgi:hypothetical protein
MILVPIIAVALLYLVLMSSFLLRLDIEEIYNLDSTVLTANMILSFYFYYMMARDAIITAKHFFSNEQQAFWYAVYDHYLFTMIDGLGLTSVAIYSSIQLRSTLTQESRLQSDNFEMFYNAAMLNVFVAYGVLLLHGLLMPGSLVLVFLWPEFITDEIIEFNQSLWSHNG